MKLAYLLFPALWLLLAVSCGNLSQVGISQSGEVELLSMKGSRATVTIPAKVDNPTGYSLRLKKVELTVYRNGYTFAELSLPKKLKIAAYSSQEQILLLDVRFKDPFALLGNDFDVESSEYTLSGTVKVGTGLLCKTLRFEEQTLEQLLHSFNL